jgi:hypothetical protein
VDKTIKTFQGNTKEVIFKYGTQRSTLTVTVLLAQIQPSSVVILKTMEVEIARYEISEGSFKGSLS